MTRTLKLPSRAQRNEIARRFGRKRDVVRRFLRSTNLTTEQLQRGYPYVARLLDALVTLSSNRTEHVHRAQHGAWRPPR